MKKLILLVAFIFCFSNTNAQNNDITKSGDIIQMVIPEVALISTFIWKDDKTKPTWQFIKAYGSSIIVTQTLKHIIQKPRPDGSDNFSFPSGHTTSAFTGAAFIQRRYGWKYGIPAYVLSSYVGYTRIQARKHDSWDVLAGATIGIGSAYLFTKPYQKNKVDVTINKTEGGYIVGFNYTF